MGCGRVGATLARTLASNGQDVAVIDMDAKSFRRLGSDFEGKTVTGVGFDRAVLTTAGIKQAYAFAAVSSGDNSNIISARVARETFGVERVAARIYDPRRAMVYQCLGIPTVATVRWTADQGLTARELHGDLRDLIARAPSEGGTVTVGPADTLLTAYNRMRQADVSQLPVLDDGRLIGLVDESDLLEAVEERRPDRRFAQPVSSAMTAKLHTVQASEPLEALLPIFDKDQVVLVLDGREFLGLITRIDLINYLRRAT